MILHYGNSRAQISFIINLIRWGSAVMAISLKWRMTVNSTRVPYGVVLMVTGAKTLLWNVSALQNILFGAPSVVFQGEEMYAYALFRTALYKVGVGLPYQHLTSEVLPNAMGLPITIRFWPLPRISCLVLMSPKTRVNPGFRTSLESWIRCLVKWW